MCNDVAVSIGKALQVNTTLQILDISYNKITSDGACVFTDYLRDRGRGSLKIILSTLWNDGKHLVLDFTAWKCVMRKINFGDIGTILLSKFLYTNTVIQELDISWNCISDNGVLAIGEYLKSTCCTLKDLNMSANEITSEGVIILENSNSKLCNLDLTHNLISKSGLQSIYDIYRTLRNT